MLHVRLALVWLLAVLLPLQGYAAAAKLCCHHGTAHQNTSTRGVGAHKAQKIDAGLADTGRASNATTLHANQRADALNTALLPPATSSTASAPPAVGKLKASKVSAVEAAADKNRKSTGCGVCGALCHSAALTPAGQAVPAGPSAAEEPRLLVTTIAKRPFDVAEKPPRT
jgi:ferredoxin